MIYQETIDLLSIGFGYGMLFGVIGGGIGYGLNAAIQIMNLYR